MPSTSVTARGPRQSLLVVALLATLGFAVNWSVARALEQRGMYNDMKVWFGSDANLYLPRLVAGVSSPKRHPLLHMFVSPLVWVGAKALHVITHAEEMVLRRQIVLLVVPIAGAVKTVCLLLLI
jgi:hypothetical protein